MKCDFGTARDFPLFLVSFQLSPPTGRRQEEKEKQWRKGENHSEFLFKSYNAQIRSQFDVILLGCKNLDLVRLNWVKMHQVYIKIHNYGNLTALWMSFQSKKRPPLNVNCCVFTGEIQEEEEKEAQETRQEKEKEGSISIGLWARLTTVALRCSWPLGSSLVVLLFVLPLNTKNLSHPASVATWSRRPTDL